MFFSILHQFSADTIQNKGTYIYYYKDTINRINTTNIVSCLLNFRGLAYFELSNYTEAELAFRQALEHDPDFLLAKFNLAAVRSRIENSVVEE